MHRAAREAALGLFFKASRSALQRATELVLRETACHYGCFLRHARHAFRTWAGRCLDIRRWQLLPLLAAGCRFDHAWRRWRGHFGRAQSSMYLNTRVCEAMRTAMLGMRLRLWASRAEQLRVLALRSSRRLRGASGLHRRQALARWRARSLQAAAERQLLCAAIEFRKQHAKRSSLAGQAGSASRCSTPASTHYVCSSHSRNTHSAASNDNCSPEFASRYSLRAECRHSVGRAGQRLDTHLGRTPLHPFPYDQRGPRLQSWVLPGRL